MKVTTSSWLVALVAASAVLGAAAYSPRPVEAALNGTKTCTPNGPGITTTSCTLTLTESSFVPPGVFFPVTMVGPAQFDPLNPPTITAAAGCLTTPTITMLTASSYRIVIQAGGCPTAPNILVTEPVIVFATGVVQQTVTSPFLDPPLMVSAPVSFTVPVPTTPANVISATKICEPVALPLPAEALTCTFTITNSTAIVNDPRFQPDYTVQISGPATLTDQGGGNPFAGSVVVASDINCPAFVRDDVPLQPAATAYQLELDVDSCPAGSTITVTETITPSAAGVLNQTVTRRDGASASATASIGAGFTRAGTFDIRCPSSLSSDPASSTFPLVVLGSIGGDEPIAIGVLPAILVCEAAFHDAAGDRVRVAPGTIEISSLNGTLVDLSGGLTTNLRIGCGRAATLSDAGLIVDLNTCEGVRFGVLGLGVGLVELRARYAPSPAAAAAGIRETEAARDVVFVAPPVSLNLLVSPNPVVVGGMGTATLRFNRVVTFAGERLINPQTGAPLVINPGTPLNGTVTFTSSTPNVAAFAGGITRAAQVVTVTVTGSGQTGVAVPTAAAATVRCGSVAPATPSAATAVTAANFRTFFGGCNSVAVRYHGVSQGTSTITATFLADLPGAFGAVSTRQGNVAVSIDAFGSTSQNSITRTLEVTGSVATTQRLVRGCNNVVAPANETVQQAAARVDPQSAVTSIWKQLPGTAQFQGAATGANVPAVVSNLSAVTALDAIFICVTAAATYRIG